MLIPHEFIYRGNLAALGEFNSQLFADCLADGDIVAVYFEAASVTSFTDSWYFGLKVNGTDVLTGANRVQITAADLEVEKTGLAIPINLRDRMSPTIDAKGTGMINGPITVIVWVSPTSKTTPVDADTVNISDSAASDKAKRLSWANVKATLKTYFDTLYVALSGDQSISGIKTFVSSPIVPTPTTATQAVNKSYADALVAGLSWKQSVRAATAAAGTLASSFENGDAIDGVTLATGDRILIKNQAAAAENGIYTVNASGAPTRSTDADSAAELVNASVYVSEGTANADKQFVCTTNAPITLGVTSISFAQLASGGGDLVSTNNLSDLTNAGTARTNLGLAIGTNVQAWDTDLDTWATKTAPAGTPVGTTDTQTLTNKRVTARIGSTISSATPTPDADAHDIYEVTALAAGATFAAPTGTPTDGQPLMIRIKDNGTARTLAFNAIYRAVGVTLPTTTTISKTMYLGCIYDSADSKWDVIGYSLEA